MNPLFITTEEDLMKSLKLQGAEDLVSVAPIVEDALKRVRLGFFRELGSDRIAEIVAMVPAEDPLTDDELTREMAIQVELAWTKAELIGHLDTFYVQNPNAAIAQRTGVEYPDYADTQPDQSSEMKRSLMSFVNDNLEGLKNDFSGDTDTSPEINACVPSPATSRTVGHSIYSTS